MNLKNKNNKKEINNANDKTKLKIKKSTRNKKDNNKNNEKNKKYTITIGKKNNLKYEGLNPGDVIILNDENGNFFSELHVNKSLINFSKLDEEKCDYSLFDYVSDKIKDKLSSLGIIDNNYKEINNCEEKNKEDNKDNNFKKLKNSFKNKLEDLYYNVKFKLEDLESLLKRIKKAIKGDEKIYTWSLDYKIIEMIVNNLPNYKQGYPVGLSQLEWDVIKEKIIYLGNKILNHEDEIYEFIQKNKKTIYGNEVFSISDKKDKLSNIEFDIYFIPREEFDKKLINIYKRQDKEKKEFVKLISKYFYNLWD